VSFNNGLDLNGAVRTIAVQTTSGTPASSTATITGTVVNTNGVTVGGLTKTGAGHLILSNTGNTYNGATTITAGTLSAAATGSLGNSSATNTLIFNGGTLRATGTITSVATRAVTMTATGIIDTNAFAVSIAGNIGGAGGLTKNNTGTLTLSGTNNYGGVTTVNAGTLAIAKEVSLASNTAANLNVKSGTTLALNVDSAATAGFTASNLSTLLGNISVANPAQGLQAGATIGIDTSTASGATFTQGNAIADSTGAAGGAVGLTKLGAGTFILDKANTYTGITTITTGTLQFNAGGGIQSAILNNATLSGNSASALTQGTHFGLISGTGTVIQNGAGALTLNLANAYTGDTRVNAGTIVLGNTLALRNSAFDTASINGGLVVTGYTTPTLGGLTGSVSLSSTLITGYGNVTDLILNPQTGITKTYNGAIVDGATGMSLTMAGAGTQVFTGIQAFTGATNLNGGTLSLSGTGTINSTTALNLGGGILQLTNTAQVNRFADVAISATAGGGVSYNNSVTGGPTYTESLGALTLTKGQVNVLLNVDHNASAGSQTLTFGTAGTGNLTQGGGRGTITFSAPTTGLNATKNRVAVFGATASGAGNIIGPWATVGTAANVQTAYAAYDASGYVVAATPTVAANDAALSSSTGNYDINTGSLFTFTGTRTVNAVMFRGSTSTLDLSTFKLETNGFFFSGGAANGKTITATGTGALTTASGGGNLYITTGQVMTTGNEHKIFAPITDNSGTVHLVKSGAGTLILNASNTFTGNLDINAGTLQIGQNAVVAANGARLGGGSYAGNIFIAAGANLDFQTNVDQTLSGVISGDGNLLKRATGTLTLSGANTYTGKTTIGAITNNPSPTLVVSSFNSVSNPMASSSLGRPTTVANGTIEMGSNNSSPNPTIRYVGTGETTDRIINFNFNSSATRTLDASNGSGLLKFTSPFTANNLNTGGIALTGTGAGEIAALPFLFGTLTKSGNGTWTLAGPSGSVGSVSVTAGTLIATDPRALGAAIGSGITTGPTISGTGTLSLRNNSSVTFGVEGTGYNINNSASGATINVDRVSGTGAATMSVGNLTTTSTSATWQLNFTGANGASLNAGALTAPLSTATGTHTINNTIATTNDASLTLASISAPSTFATPTLNFDGAGNTLVTGNITQTTAALKLTKNGAGKLTLNGSASYTGTTTVNAGILAVNGSLGNTSTTVGGTGTLQGSGSTVGSVTINSGGTLAAGNSIESLATGALTLNASSTFAYEIDNDAAATVAGDLTAVTGNLTLDLTNAAILTINELGAGTWLPGEKLTLISYTATWNGGLFNYGGTLADDSNFMFSGVQWLFNYNDTSEGTNYTADSNGTFVTMTVVPEPRAALLGGLGLLMLLRRRR
jgi:fibronectin-binding autotransporter adhesin